jgi:hypothetical protein
MSSGMWCAGVVVYIYIVASCLLSPMSRSLTNLAGAGECPRGARPPPHPSPSPKSGHVAWAPKVRRLMIDHGRGVGVAVVPRTCMNIGDSAIRTRVRYARQVLATVQTADVDVFASRTTKREWQPYDAAKNRRFGSESQEANRRRSSVALLE